MPLIMPIISVFLNRSKNRNINFFIILKIRLLCIEYFRLLFFAPASLEAREGRLPTATFATKEGQQRRETRERRPAQVTVCSDFRRRRRYSMGGNMRGPQKKIFYMTDLV